jgi:hypothetical protein
MSKLSCFGGLSMVDYIEVKPIPEVCKKCMETQTDEEECYNCDYALERWQLLPKTPSDMQEK